jgi:hypothetical protein
MVIALLPLFTTKYKKDMAVGDCDDTVCEVWVVKFTMMLLGTFGQAIRANAATGCRSHVIRSTLT